MNSSYLQAALPLGAIRPDEVRRLIEAERTGNKQGILSDVVQFPHYFAIELAYVIEHFGKDSEEDAKQILDLYLKGSKSLMLAVSYSQRNTTFGSQLWAILIDHCLTSAQDEDGSLFGSLLECAAQCGADLAHLVTQIPQGMQIEGLRPRLVAAVADYRWKLKMHEAASSIGTNERIVLLRELAHRSKRGMRFSKLATSDTADGMSPPASPSKDLSQNSKAEVATIPNRPLERPNRYRLAFPVPIR
jgi:vacuolar protein sorting-associated protein 41